ncbi:hypothetical protein [Streptomyces sp. SYSU K21746]
MSNAVGLSNRDHAGRKRGALSRVGTLSCAVVLVLMHLVTSYFVFLAYMAEPVGPWDTETVAHSNITASLALVASVLGALLTLVSVLAQWLRRWWYALPALLAIAALLRLTVLAPQL